MFYHCLDNFIITTDSLARVMVLPFYNFVIVSYANLI